MAEVTLFDLLGVTDAATAAMRWPSARIRGNTGADLDAQALTDLLTYLNTVLSFSGFRAGASPGSVGFHVDVRIGTGVVKPIVLAAMPRVEFLLKSNLPPATLPAHVYVTQSATGTEVVIEGLPVEIKLPHGMFEPLGTEGPGALGEVMYPEAPYKFQPGTLDSLQVRLSDIASSIFVHLKVRMTEELEFVIEPAVPISVGPCRFSGVPCRGVHDLQLVPSPVLGGAHDEREQALEWVRNPLDGLPVNATHRGLFTARTVDVDPTSPPFDELSARLNHGGTTARRLEIVISDLALPFFNSLGLPIPVHGLFGLRQEYSGEGLPFLLGNAAKAVVPIGGWQLEILQLLAASWGLLEFQAAFVAGRDTPAVPASDTQPGTDEEPASDKNTAIVFGIGDEWTVQLGVRAGDQQPGRELFSVMGTTVAITGFVLGASIKRIARGAPTYGPKDMLQVLLDFRLSAPTTSTGIVNISSSSGGPIEATFREIGWSLGSFALPTSASFKEGMKITIAKKFELLFNELGILAEQNGGQYFYFSGGIALNLGQSSSGSTGSSSGGKTRFGVTVDRLRFRIGGNPTAPAFLIDGASLAIEVGMFSLTGFGLIREYNKPSPTAVGSNHHKELGFGVQVQFDAAGKHFLFGVQYFDGRVTGVDNFAYWLLGLQYSPLPISAITLTDIALLLAGNMEPVLPPPSGNPQHLRLFQWYKDNDEHASIIIQDSRQLSAWRPKDQSFAFGLGFGITLSAGALIRVAAFAFYHDSPGDSGLLVAIEIFLLKSKRKIGWAALEIDLTSGDFAVIIGVEITFANILDAQSLPNWINFLKLTGTLYFGNHPATFALGQINDQDSWLQLAVKYPTPPASASNAKPWMEVRAMVGLCVQIVDTPTGPKAGGLVLAARGKLDFGVGELIVYASLGFILGVWRNESKAFAFLAWFEAGLRLRLLVVFEFGVSVRVQFDYMGSSAAYIRLGGEVHIETAWFLPDVNFRFEKIWSEPQPEMLALISTPLVAGGALPASRRPPAQASGTARLPEVLVTPVLGSAPAEWTAIEPAKVYSINELSAAGGRAPSDAALDAFGVAVGCDSAIGLDFKPSVDGLPALGLETVPGAGIQGGSASNPNELTVRYGLASIGIRRRPRFGTVWSALAEPEDSTLDNIFTLPPGTDLLAHFRPSVSYRWDADVQRHDGVDPRRLLINAATPYSFLTSNPMGDETLARTQGGWPCCDDAMEMGPDSDGGLATSFRPHGSGVLVSHREELWHSLDFSADQPGRRARATQVYSASSSYLHWLVAPRPVIADSASDPSAQVARVALAGRPEGGIASIELDGLALDFELTVSWLEPPVLDHDTRFVHATVEGTLVVEAFRDLELLEQRTVPLTGSSVPPIAFHAARGLSSVSLRYIPPDQQSVETLDAIEIISSRYRSLEDTIRAAAHLLSCAARRAGHLDGSGVLAWLPNHVYEISVATKVQVTHQRTGTLEKTLEQRAYFRTKGLPGLNAVERIGDELEHYIESVYPGRSPRRLYRVEPAALAFSPGFNLLVPLLRGGPGTSDERSQLLEWVLAIEKLGARGSELISLTSADWLEAHRPPAPPLPPVVSPPGFRPPVLELLAGTGVINPADRARPVVRFEERTAPTLDPFQKRYDQMSQRPGACPAPLSLARSRVLLHDPLDPSLPAAGPQHWQASATYRANVRRKGGPFLWAPSFGDRDAGAFSAAAESGTPLTWTSDAARLRLQSPVAPSSRQYALAGETDWDHLQVHVEMDTAGGEAGVAVAVGIDPAQPALVRDGILVLVDGSGLVLRLVDRRKHVETELARATIPAPDPASTTPLALEVFLFDDTVRARVGEVIVEHARRAGQGRVGLVAHGPAAFTRLVVEPLDAYRFDFETSRFLRFEDHIQSFVESGGAVTAIPAGMADPAALLLSTVSRVYEAMAPGADPAVRQRLFDEWTTTLRLPWRDKPVALSLSRLDAAGRSPLVLVEGQESLPFSTDVTLSIARDSHVPPLVPHRPFEPAPHLPGRTNPPPGIIPRPDRIPGPPRGTVQPGEVSDRVPPTEIRPPIHHPPVATDPHLLVLTDGSETRAILIPTDGADRHQSLDPGSYRLTFTLNRARYATDGTPSSDGTYAATSQLLVALG